MDFYPYSCPDIREEDVEAVSDLLRRGAFLSQGPEITTFEEELAAEIGCKHAVVCNSGTAALHLAFLALEAGPAMPRLPNNCSITPISRPLVGVVRSTRSISRAWSFDKCVTCLTNPA